MRYMLMILLLSGCGQFDTELTGIGKVGTYTEAYTGFHNVPVKEHPTTPVEWQAKANNECVDMLMSWRLPDSNFGWKYPRMATMCVFSFARNECVCMGPQPISRIESRWPNEARFSTLPEPTSPSRFRELAKQVKQNIAAKYAKH